MNMLVQYISRREQQFDSLAAQTSLFLSECYARVTTVGFRKRAKSKFLAIRQVMSRRKHMKVAERERELTKAHESGRVQTRVDESIREPTRGRRGNMRVSITF